MTTSATSQPPSIARRLLVTVVGSGEARQIEPSLAELFEMRVARDGRQRAQLWYWRQVLGFGARRRALQRARAEELAAGVQRGSDSRNNSPQWSPFQRDRRRFPGSIPMDSVLQDCRYAVRMLLKNPGFTSIAVLVLALGIGANTATFTLTNTLMLRPIQAEAPDELVALYSKNTKLPDTFRAFSYPNFEDIRELNTTFSSMLAHDMTTIGVREGEVTQRLFAELVSHDYFDTFGVEPFRGRFFTPAEETPGSGIPVAVVSYSYWQKHGSDPDLVGKTIGSGNQEFTVVGIAPQYFTGRTVLIAAAVYLPLGMERAVAGFGGKDDALLAERTNHRLLLMGRLQPGVSLDEANLQLTALSERLAEAFPEINADQTIFAGPLARLGVSTAPDNDAGVGLVAALLLGMTGAVLLIACINLANMLLARGAVRQREFAVRAAIGGDRARILRQLLTEGLVLSLLGGAAGLVVATWANSLLVASMRQLLVMNGLGMDIVLRTTPDYRVLLATAAFCVFGTLAFGLGPAWQQSRPDVMSALRQQAGDPSNGRPGRLLSRRNLLVVSQLALSLVLLISAGLFVRAALAAANVDPGFSLENGIVAEVDPSLVSYDEARSKDIYRELQERLRAMPGVRAVSVAATVPFGSVSSGRRVRRAEDLPTATTDGSESIETVSASSNVIGAEYFDTLGVKILRGRDFTRAETESAPGAKVAIIDELLADRLWPGQDPIGRFIGLGRERDPEGGDEMEVVGLVATIRDDLFPAEPQPHIYQPLGQAFQTLMTVHIATAPLPDDDARAAYLQSVRQTIRSVDAQLPIVSMKPLQLHVAESASLWVVKLGATMFSAFGLLALFLAVIGVYGVKAYAVAQRTREIGIRKALGATTSGTLWMVMRESAKVTAVGLGLGIVLALGVARLLASLLYEVSAMDPITFVLGTGVLAAAALAATYIPALRAARVAPTTALREG